MSGINPININTGTTPISNNQDNLEVDDFKSIFFNQVTEATGLEFSDMDDLFFNETADSPESQGENLIEFETFFIQNSIFKNETKDIDKIKTKKLVVKIKKEGEKPDYRPLYDTNRQFGLHGIVEHELNEDGKIETTVLNPEDYVVTYLTADQYVRIQFATQKAFDELAKSYEKHKKESEEAEEAKKKLQNHSYSPEKDTATEKFAKNRFDQIEEANKNANKGANINQRKQDIKASEEFREREGNKSFQERKFEKKETKIKTQEENKEKLAEEIKNYEIKRKVK